MTHSSFFTQMVICNIHCSAYFFLFLKIFYLFIFRERGREGEREGEKHQSVRDWFNQSDNDWLPLTCPRLGTWPETQARALPGN